MIRSLAAAAALLGAMPAASVGVRDIRADVAAPIAVRGGVLMLPLTAGRPGDRWPTTLRLTLEDGRRLEGRVAWIEPAPAPAWSRWTVDPRSLAARWVGPEDDSSRPETGAPYLLAWLPDEGEGALRLGEQSLQPDWRDRPIPAAALRPRGILPLADHPGRPDRYSPFAYWRWVLLAQRLDLDPPPPATYGEAGALVAVHYADLWRVGLARLGSLSPGVAAHCRDLLTQTCRDGDLTFAAWVADPQQDGALLGVLLDPRRRDEAVRQAALAWADSQDLTLVWAEPAEAGQVRLAIANPTFEPRVAQFLWQGDDGIPVAAALETGAVTRIDLDRPAAAPPAAANRPPAVAGLARAPHPAPDVLLMSTDRRRQRLVFAPTVIAARPPGVYVTPLRPAHSLPGLQGGGAAQVSPERATVVHLRRRAGRWEVFLECRREAPAAPGGDPSAWPDAEAALGTEAITLLFGPAPDGGGPSVVLAVPETGGWRLFAGPAAPDLEIHRRSYRDRWFCRVVLPEAWLPDPLGGAPLQLGVVRTHQGTGELESAPYAVLPWRPDPGRVSIDLDAWEGLAQRGGRR